MGGHPAVQALCPMAWVWPHSSQNQLDPRRPWRHLAMQSPPGRSNSPYAPSFTLCHEMPQDILQALEHGRGDLEVGSVLHGAHLALSKEPICKRGEVAQPDG